MVAKLTTLLKNTRDKNIKQEKKLAVVVMARPFLAVYGQKRELKKQLFINYVNGECFFFC